MSSPEIKYKKHILIVDDDDGLRDMLVMAVESAGHKALPARNGREGLAIAESTLVHAVISDVQMPEMDGLKMFEHLRPHEVPVILMTGFADALNAETAKKIGVADFLGKPFTNEQILNSVSVALEQDDLRRRSFGASLDNHFCKIEIDQFGVPPQAGAEVFVRLSPNRYVRISRREAPMTKERMEAYRARGLTGFYIQKNDFARRVGFNLASNSPTEKQFTDQEKVAFIRQSTDLDLEQIRAPSLHPHTFDEGKLQVENTMQLMSESEILFAMLMQLREGSQDRYGLSLAVALYGSLISKAIEPKNNLAIHKTALAGLLQEVTAKELLDQVAGLPADVIAAANHRKDTQTGNAHAMISILEVSRLFCEMTLTQKMSPQEAIRQICQMNEDKTEPALTRALMDIFEFPRTAV